MSRLAKAALALLATLALAGCILPPGPGPFGPPHDWHGGGFGPGPHGPGPGWR